MDALEAETGTRGVAYEMLGPPRLAKLLFEAELLRRLAGDDLDRAAALDPAATALEAERMVLADRDLRSRMLSAGLPVLLGDGERGLRGPQVNVPPVEGAWDAAARAGWVDLRESSWALWRTRLAEITRRLEGTPGAAGGSRWDMEPWQRARRVRPGALAAWVFRYEDGGERIKR
jgi:hypothetical protein